jgi:hypothetical protein
MSNHYHLVVETPNANLVAGMAWLQSTYTIRLNHRHKTDGPRGQSLLLANSPEEVSEPQEAGSSSSIAGALELRCCRLKIPAPQLVWAMPG